MNKQMISVFLIKLFGILGVLEVTEKKDELIKTLTASFFINFTRLMATDEKVLPILKEFSSQTENNDPSKLFEFLDTKDVECESFAMLASKETLDNFVANLESTLSPEKIEELKKIVAA